MPNIITPSVARPNLPTVTNTTIVNRPTTIGANHTIYATTLPVREFDSSNFNGTMLVYVDSANTRLTNNGILWSYQTGDRLGLADFAVASARSPLTNNGTIVLQNDTGVGYAVFAAGDMFNNGSIYAISQDGVVYGYVTEDQFSVVTNTGYIGADSVTGSATGVFFDNGGRLINDANGVIQAAGANATAVTFIRGAYAGADATYLPSVENRGLIEAISSQGSGPSVGIYLSHLEFEWMQIVNSGTIRADIAIFATGGNFSPYQRSTDRVENTATGVIEGTIYLDAGDDILLNNGRINGQVLLGDGDDLFDNSGGTLIGFADLGFGADRFLGGAGADYVRGEAGNDWLQGNGGNDLLIGDWGDDVLIGGAGSDGLYGDSGADRIVTQGRDTVYGGSGNDRVELGDFSFGLVNGESGFDTLVLPSFSGVLNLTTALATGRILSFEFVQLANQGGLAIAAGNVANITAGLSQLYVGGGTGSALHLVGSWTASGTQTFDGALFNAFHNGSEQVYAQQGVTVSISASAPSSTIGLNTLSGAVAPLPGIVAGSDIYGGATFANFFVLQSDLTIDESEIWFSENGNSVFAINGSAVLDNAGLILSVSGAVPESANGFLGFVQSDLERLGWHDNTSTARGSMAVYSNLGRLIDNSGTIYSETTQDGISVATFVAQRGPVLNTGSIVSVAVNGAAIGVVTFDSSLGPDTDEPYSIDNRGDIFVTSQTDRAIGLWNHNGAAMVNSGSLDVSGGAGAYAIITSTGGMNFTNIGSIAATTTGIGGEASVAFHMWLNMGVTINNSGTITADELITDYSTYSQNLTLVNSGTITANISTFASRDTVTNSGVIEGDIRFAGGNDTYINRGGTISGVIDGGEGTDRAIYQGDRTGFTVFETARGEFSITGAFGTDHVVSIESLEFGNFTVRLDTGAGIFINALTADPDAFMVNIRDYDGNDLGGSWSWERIGRADTNGDGSGEYIFVNREIGRFAEVGVDANGRLQFDDHGLGGDTRVVGIYIDPLVESGDVISGSDFDSQQRFQNDLYIGNISSVLGGDDYDGDGLQEIYFALTDGSAYLHAYLHADGNIQYANYQSQEQVIEFLTANGYDASTYGNWFSNDAQIPDKAATKTSTFEPQFVAAAFADFHHAALGDIYAEFYG